MKTVRLRRWLYRISAARRWTPVHPSQRFNFPRDNSRTCYLGEDPAVCRVEVFGRSGGLVPLSAFLAKAQVDLMAWDLRSCKGLEKSLARLVGDPRHTWEVKMLATRARRAGIQAVLYRSVRDRRKWCVAVFLENVRRSQFRRARWKALR
jgi:hypothetical protein